MAAVPALVSSEQGIHDAVTRLAAIEAGSHRVVSCYLKLELRDKTRGKYLIKMKNRVRDALQGLSGERLSHAEREDTAADLHQVLDFLEAPARLPATQGIALFASRALGLFEVLALPHVHRSRLAVAPTPLIRELVALDEEFGTILVAACDRTAARLFTVTAFDSVELPGVTSPSITRGGRFHGSRQVRSRGGTPSGSAGEHNYHQRIRNEKQRLYALVADRVFQINARQPLAGVAVAGIGVDAGALVPHLHTYLHDLVLGVVRLNPKKVSAGEVRAVALALREGRERSWERAHADAVREGVPTGWAVNGVAATLKVLARGQARTFLADGQRDDPRIDDALEDALRQRAQVDVLYDDRARRAIDTMAALLRFRG